MTTPVPPSVQGGAGPEPLTTDSGGAPQPPAGPRPIAAFDFDGTLTVEDSFTAFLRWRTTGWGWAIGLLRLAPAATLYLLNHDRGRLKAASINVFLRGASRDVLERQAAAFALAEAERLFRPDALQCWAEHCAAGHQLVIVTASPQELVAPFAQRLGADALIGSRLSWTAEQTVGEGLDGPNCRGPEKVRRLRERFGSEAEIGYAYGDTSGDREMLAMARRGHMKLFKGRPRRSAAPMNPSPRLRRA